MNTEQQNPSQSFEQMLARLKDYKQIAEHLGINNNTIYDRLSKGLVENKIYHIGKKKYILVDEEKDDWGIVFSKHPAGKKVSPRKKKVQQAFGGE